ncbi:MAG: TonB-dependent receptor [Gemmatimonadota bacterium]
MHLHAPTRLSKLISSLVAAFVFALPVAAQTGSITGTVVDKSGKQPLNGVQLSIEGTQIGTLSDARGRYTIARVPNGQVVVRATYIGYRSETQTVSVSGTTAVTANFELGVSAVSLNEIVVTGTAGAAEKRQLGATIATVSVANIQEKVGGITDVGSVLQSRIAGVRSMGTVGGVGASKDLRIRGTSSFSLGQRPLVYIDGVKIDTRQREWSGMGTSCCSYSGGAGTDRLADLNPNDIERIEVIKGAAAGTLYGTEATNGVIQIFTKKGRSDSAPRWSAQVTSGFQRFRENFQTKEWPKFTGPDGTVALDANKSLIENGPYLGADVTVQGGSNTMTYFVSGGYVDENGSISPNWMKRGNLRMNMHWIATQKLSFDVTSAYTRNRIYELQSGNNWTSLLGNAVLGVPYNACGGKTASGEQAPACTGTGGPYGEPWVPISAIKRIETFDDANRWTGGVTANYSPGGNFNNKFQVGLDAVGEEKSYLRPFGYPYTYVPAGEKDLGYRNYRSVTAEYLGTISFNDILPNLNTNVSFGAQGFQTVERFNMAIGKEYSAPGVTTVSGGAIRSGSEQFEERVQLGFFGQNRFSFQDKIFLTTGVRVDGNSAFGDDYGYQVYPNAQLSYDLGGESWKPAFISALRLRGAVGTAGLAPGAFDKFLTFEPLTTGDDQPGVHVDDQGNPDLGPERTTEYEAGFEAGFWNDRVGFDFTVYRRKTKDAIVRIGRAPSLAFGGAPRENVGGVLDQGYELALRVTPIEASRLRWSTDLRLDGNHNEITDLGTAECEIGPRCASGDSVVMKRGNLRVGLPVLTQFTRMLCTERYSQYNPRDPRNGGCSTWLNGVENGTVVRKTAYNPTTRQFTRTDTTVYIGKALPDFNVSLGNELSFGAFRLYGLVTLESGAFFGNSDRPYRANNRTGPEYLGALAPAGSAACVTSWPTGAQGPRFPDAAKQWCDTVQSDSIYQMWRVVSPQDSRDNIRIREVSMGYQVPESLSSKLGISRTQITLAAQNLQWWDDCNCMDPNMNYQGGSDFGVASGFLGQPQPRMFKLSVRTTF